jgi:hypothetical protein
MVVGMYLTVKSEVDPLDSGLYNLELHYADDSFKSLGPSATRQVKVSTTEDLFNYVYENLEDATTAFYGNYTSVAIADLNTFVGTSIYTLFGRLQTDKGTLDEILARDETIYDTLFNALSNKAPFYHTHTINDVSDLASGVSNKVDELKGVADGIAPLNSSGKIPSVYMTSIVQHYANVGAFPVSTALKSVIYISEEENRFYRWTGSQYVTVPYLGNLDYIIEDAPTNAPVSIDSGTATVSILTAELNATNAKLNSTATKLNSVLDFLEMNGFMPI